MRLLPAKYEGTKRRGGGGVGPPPPPGGAPPNPLVYNHIREGTSNSTATDKESNDSKDPIIRTQGSFDELEYVPLEEDFDRRPGTRSPIILAS